MVPLKANVMRRVRTSKTPVVIMKTHRAIFCPRSCTKKISCTVDVTSVSNGAEANPCMRRMATNCGKDWPVECQFSTAAAPGHICYAFCDSTGGGLPLRKSPKHSKPAGRCRTL